MERNERCIMTTDIAQNIADDGADAAETAETTETVTGDRGNRYRIDGGAAVADHAWWPRSVGAVQSELSPVCHVESAWQGCDVLQAR